jgi:hypothetical protein
MKMLLAFLDGVLSGLRESRVSAHPSERMNLAPVWVMPFPTRSETH